MLRPLGSTAKMIDPVVCSREANDCDTMPSEQEGIVEDTERMKARYQTARR